MNLNQTIEAARNVLRFKHMAVKTEKSYVHWIRRFAFWCKDHPAGGHEDKVRGFLTHLARGPSGQQPVKCATFAATARSGTKAMLPCRTSAPTS